MTRTAKGRSLALQTAEHKRDNLAERLRRHLKVCKTCTPLTGIRSRYCQEGWELAKELQQARSAIIELQAGCGDKPLALF